MVTSAAAAGLKGDRRYYKSWRWVTTEELSERHIGGPSWTPKHGLGTARLPAQSEGTCYTAPVGSADELTADDSSVEAASALHQLPVQYVSVTSSPLDHSYSLTTGTTSAELLRKLNEQRDIIALMEVKMKEMKATIRQLRVAEAKLQEEVRERDRLLYGNSVAFSVRKKI